MTVSHSQVLVPREDGLMGRMVRVHITSAGKHYVMGELTFNLRSAVSLYPYTGEVVREPLVRLPSPPLKPDTVSTTTRPLAMDTKVSLWRPVKGQSSVDLFLVGVVVCVICWLLAQHSNYLITTASIIKH